MKKLKNRPLSLQIWIVFSFVIVVVFSLLIIYFSMTIRSFFKEEVYSDIKAAQRSLLEKGTNSLSGTEEADESPQSGENKDVKHIRMNLSKNEANLIKVQKVIPNRNAAEIFLRKLERQAESQALPSKEYIQRTASGRILYVITITDKKGDFLVSYMWDNYRNSLSAKLLRRLFSVMIIALIISLAAAKFLAQRLVNPLRQLQLKVKQIGKKQWYESVDIGRQDEIGELSRSIEEMRKELVKQDEYEQTMLQQASHDLKTPLMVIRSYVQAVEDGIYPKGNLESTMKVIDSEAERMQKRIKNLLYLTKINYMSRHKDEFGKVNIKGVIEAVVDGFMYNDRNIAFQVDIPDLFVTGEEEQWSVVFENIMDNELRYAKSLINISIVEEKDKVYISIYNDGEKIPEDKLEGIFGTFNKDKGGNFGLGLDIARRIVVMYEGSIKAQNCDDGVAFVIGVKKHNG